MTVEEIVQFGDLLRVYRRQKGLTQIEIAKKAGIADSYITLIETGRRKNMSRETVDRIINALDLNEAEKEDFYYHTGYCLSLPYRKMPRARYPALYKVLTSKPKNVSIRNFTASISDIVKVIGRNVNVRETRKYPKGYTKEEFTKILITGVLIRAIAHMYRRE